MKVSSAKGDWVKTALDGAAELLAWSVKPAPVPPRVGSGGVNGQYVVSEFSRGDGLFAETIRSSDNTLESSSSSGADKKPSKPSKLFPYVRKASLSWMTALPELVLLD